MSAISTDGTDPLKPGEAPSLSDERELNVLAHVQAAGTEGHARHSQRSIARALGMSVGLTNAILKRLGRKGFVMMQRVNHNNVHYLLTPAGVEEVSRRSYLYLRRTVGHVVRYRDRLRAFCRTQKEAGVHGIELRGKSDVAFILEWAAMKEGLAFTQRAATDALPAEEQDHAGCLTVYAETLSAPAGAASLTEILLASDVLG